MNDLERQLLEVLADVQALRQTNEKLDMILTARLGGPVYSACELETSPVRAPLEAVVEEADADGEIAKEDRLPETSVTAPRFGADAAPAEPPGEWSPEDEGIAPPRDGLASFPSFQVEASFPEESQEQEPEPPMSHKEVPEPPAEAALEEELPPDDPELDAVWDSFFPAVPVPEEAPEQPDLPPAPPAPSAPPAAAEEVPAAEEAGPVKGKDVTSMSRRERIRLLEREEALLTQTDAQFAQQEAAAAPLPAETENQDTAQLALDAAHALHEHLQGITDDRDSQSDDRAAARRERIAQLERGVAGERFVEDETESTEKSDAQWLDARRQQRKTRLRQKARGEVVSPEVEINTLLPEDAVEGLANDSQHEAACKCLARQAHRLSTERLLRAVELLLLGGRTSNDEDRAFAAAEAILGSLATAMGSLTLEQLMNCLKLMALTGQQEQTTLDMLLAQLLVLSRRDGSFSCGVLSDFCGALGRLHDAGLSAKRGASSSNCTANRRCLEMVMQLITRQVSEFNDQELAGLGASFVLNYMDDVLRRLVIRQAATLQAGLASEGLTRDGMLQLEEAVRTHSFAFIASLPDESKDYLLKLKMIRQEAAARAVLSSASPEL